MTTSAFATNWIGFIAFRSKLARTEHKRERETESMRKGMFECVSLFTNALLYQTIKMCFERSNTVIVDTMKTANVR